jgi:hypothetical protein
MPTVPVFLDDCLYAAHETRGMGRKQKVAVRVAGDKILVTLPGTNFNVTYERSSEGPGLVASAFGGRKDEDNKVKLPEFLASAWTAANDKARELGWIK